MRIFSLFALGAVFVTCPTAIGQRSDLTGTWTNASLTTLNRPAGVDKLILSKAEADAVVARINIAGFAPRARRRKNSAIRMPQRPSAARLTSA